MRERRLGACQQEQWRQQQRDDFPDRHGREGRGRSKDALRRAIAVQQLRLDPRQKADREAKDDPFDDGQRQMDYKREQHDPGPIVRAAAQEDKPVEKDREQHRGFADQQTDREFDGVIEPAFGPRGESGEQQRRGYRQRVERQPSGTALNLLPVGSRSNGKEASPRSTCSGRTRRYCTRPGRHETADDESTAGDAVRRTSPRQPTRESPSRRR